jgi:hypothetical protein
MEDKKEFYVNVSFSGKLGLLVQAMSEEEIKEKIYEALSTMDIKSTDEDVQVEEIEWDLITEAPRGNMATPYVRDIDITQYD